MAASTGTSSLAVRLGSARPSLAQAILCAYGNAPWACSGRDMTGRSGCPWLRIPPRRSHSVTHGAAIVASSSRAKPSPDCRFRRAAQRPSPVIPLRVRACVAFSEEV
ncbi:hypothetical protein BV20DRAFT_973891 [Pilatotrama ljubarskyi]|nr:hypothetical protein BV20DRAFT_973891 [Pilatotrama ljubarskyi]